MPPSSRAQPLLPIMLPNRSSSQLLCHNIRSFRASTRFTTVPLSLSLLPSVGRTLSFSYNLLWSFKNPFLTKFTASPLYQHSSFTPLYPLTLPSNLLFAVVFHARCLLDEYPNLRILVELAPLSFPAPGRSLLDIFFGLSSYRTILLELMGNRIHTGQAG